ncbi:MAG: ATP-binding protein [Fimbriiglobus sp.]|jgi:C4-dicarboxylate-specific signal transduction histidine kinase|nr:ATP-binding protein [Fimbriiglobus sp.]
MPVPLRPPPWVLSLLLVAVVFTIDLSLPLGVASAVPYTFAVLLALADRRAWVGPVVAGLCGVLTIGKLGIVHDRGETEMWKVIANRCLAVFAIGITTLLGILQRKAATARERAEELLRTHQADLAHVGRLSLLGQVAAGLAHELNQPLSAIGLQAELARRWANPGEPLRPEVADALAEIAGQSARAADIIRGIRRLARRDPPGTDPVAVDEVMRAAVALLGWQAGRVGAAVRVTAGGPQAVVEADRVQLEQVLVNLLQNALDAVAGMPDARRWVELTARADADTVTVQVRDGGPGGFDPARLFQPFYTTKAGGLGLGLAISRGIVEAHGGRLWAEPSPDSTEFAFTLFRVRED